MPKVLNNKIISTPVKKISKRKQTDVDKIEIVTILTKEILNPIWLAMSEAAKIGGVTNKTVRRAIQAKELKYKISGNRYLIDLSSLVHYLYKKTKLKNKLNSFGLGQYIDKWRQ